MQSRSLGPSRGERGGAGAAAKRGVQAAVGWQARARPTLAATGWGGVAGAAEAARAAGSEGGGVTGGGGGKAGGIGWQVTRRWAQVER